MAITGAWLLPGIPLVVLIKLLHDHPATLTGLQVSIFCSCCCCPTSRPQYCISHVSLPKLNLVKQDISHNNHQHAPL
jgi:hypothetical protein